jgi:hypothetical protein
MIKLVTIDEIRKQVDRTQQNGKHLEETAQRMAGLRSKLSLGIIIGSMASLDLASILLMISWI